MNKICSRCGRELLATIENFYPHPDGAGGFEKRCRDCRNEYYRDHRNKKVYDTFIVDDPIIRPAAVKIVPGAGCVNCDHEWDCRDLVLSGRQVLCAPVHQSDLWLERAYQIRQEEKL